MSERLRIILILSVVELFAMSLWFGVSAVSPAIAREGSVPQYTCGSPGSPDRFVVGTLISAISTAVCPQLRNLLMFCALAGAGANAMFADPNSVTVAVICVF